MNRLKRPKLSKVVDEDMLEIRNEDKLPKRE